MIEGHGDDIYKYRNEIKHNFSSNIYQQFNHEGTLKHLASCRNLLSAYPEPIPESLEREIASKLFIPEANVMVTAGSTDTIYTIALANRNRRSLILQPTFAEYEDACRMHEHKVDFIAEEQINSLESIDCDLFWICNPNNPTGKVIESVFLEKLVYENPDVLFVIDSAYEDYTLVDLPAVDFSVKNTNVVMMHSLTKRFGVPGLRIGYLTADSAIIEELKKFRMPWSIGTPAIEGARYLINHADEYEIPVRKLLEEALKIKKRLRQLGIEVNDSETNYLLCKLPFGKVSHLKNFLAENYGILIRDASNFHGLNERFFRIAVQSEPSNDLLLIKIEEWLSLHK